VDGDDPIVLPAADDDWTAALSWVGGDFIEDALECLVFTADGYSIPQLKSILLGGPHGCSLVEGLIVALGISEDSKRLRSILESDRESQELRVLHRLLQFEDCVVEKDAFEV
jgi:hypothetical protein